LLRRDATHFTPALQHHDPDLELVEEEKTEQLANAGFCEKWLWKWYVYLSQKHCSENIQSYVERASV